MSEILKNVVGFITTSAGQIAFNPLVTATLLWALTKAPTQLRSQITTQIPALQDARIYGRVLKALTGLLIAGSASVVNNQLNQIALNGGRLRSDKAKWNWSQEVAVITGGCSGIGEMVVTRLLARGIRVAVLDIQQLPPSLQGHAGVQFFKCDVTDPSEVYSVAEKIKDSMGAPTILINNAGILASHTILSTSDVYLQKIFQVNVLSNWYTVKAFLPDMIRNNKGHIVTVASTASFTGVGGMADYSATKSAILGFHESLNAELKIHYKSPNVLTTSIHPNYARTPLIIPIEKGLREAGEAIIEPSDIADAVVERIMSCRGGQAILPSSMKNVSMLRGLPNWIQEFVRTSVSKAIAPTVK